jgi:hypothetical protein
MDPAGDSLDESYRHGFHNRPGPGVSLTTWRRKQPGDPLALGVRSDALLEAAHYFFCAKQFEWHNGALQQARSGKWDVARVDSGFCPAQGSACAPPEPISKGTALVSLCGKH